MATLQKAIGDQVVEMQTAIKGLVVEMQKAISGQEVGAAENVISMQAVVDDIQERSE